MRSCLVINGTLASLSDWIKRLEQYFVLETLPPDPRQVKEVLSLAYKRLIVTLPEMIPYGVEALFRFQIKDDIKAARKKAKEAYR